jgi:hypothetical protein
MRRRKLRRTGKGWPTGGPRAPQPPDPETIRLQMRSREAAGPGPRVNL